ncbi:hypothetical protein VCHA53O466_40321 [Vibrio chagasii]|nr:hypothetical protein VCHA53O466_40321 [Vibrio chagasii]
MDNKDEFAFNGADKLPVSGIYILWSLELENTGSDTPLIKDMRVVTGDEYRSDKRWSEFYRYNYRLRQKKTDLGFCETSEVTAEEYGIESLILEALFTFGTISKDTMWRLTNDCKRLNVSGWGIFHEYPEKPHTLDYLEPCSNYAG